MSRGAAGKEQAISLARRFLTDVLGVGREPLRVSVLDGDTETADIWHTKVLG